MKKTRRKTSGFSTTNISRICTLCFAKSTVKTTVEGCACDTRRRWILAARERIVGWYHTGPKLQRNDISINELMREYHPDSILVVIDAKPKDLGLPTEAYIAVEEIHDVSDQRKAGWSRSKLVFVSGRKSSVENIRTSPIRNRRGRSRGSRCRTPPSVGSLVLARFIAHLSG